ncbi:MAG: hypothetical protein ACFFCK_05650, partial [Promethearchaeota archaeon]
MQERLQSELYASIATLDQLKKMFDMGLVDIKSYQRESEALAREVKHNIEDLRRVGLDVLFFLESERLPERFGDALGLLNLLRQEARPRTDGMTLEEYYDHIGLAIL